MGVGGNDKNLTEGKESISISLQSSGEGGGGGERGGLKRTDEGAKNNYSNNIIKHFSNACHVAGTVLSTVYVLIHLILIITL